MTKFNAKDCSVLITSNLLGKKWIVFILSELLSQDELFFTNLQSRVLDKTGEKISGKVLTDNLRLLEDQGIISRSIDVDRHVSYSLTEKGKDLEIVLAALKGWAVKWNLEQTKKCSSFSCIHNSVPIFNLDKATRVELINQP